MASVIRYARSTPFTAPQWRRLLMSTPGHIHGEQVDCYDPFALAGPGDWFDCRAGLRPIEFCARVLRHVKGARAGEPFEIERWQQCVLGNLFGWRRRDGTRRFRVLFLYVPKKNGKTTLAAAIALYALVADGEPGAEIYSAAASRDQAAIVFEHVAGMIAQSPGLKNALRVYGAKGGSQQRRVAYPATMSYYSCLAADANTADGTLPHASIIDELHRHRSRDLADILHKSSGGRRQPITVYLTTADYDRQSACNEQLAYARMVLANGGDPMKPGFDRAYLPIVYEPTASECEDWTAPEVAARVNPNLGVTQPPDVLADEVRRSLDSPTMQTSYKRFRLNIVTGAADAWMNMERWDACAKDELDLPDRQPVYVGIDLSSAQDTTAVAEVYVLGGGDDEAERIAVRCHFWIPEANIAEKSRIDHVPWELWAEQRHVTLCAGTYVDYQLLFDRLIQLSRSNRVVQVGYDPWSAHQLAAQLEDRGVKTLKVSQTAAFLSEPMKLLENMVLSGRLQHQSNPVLRWQMGNVSAFTDSSGNIKPNKRHSAGRIDGPCAIINALSRAATNPILKFSPKST